MEFSTLTTYVAQLSALELTDQEKETLIVKLQAMINHFQKISQLQTDQVEPLITPFSRICVLREDIPVNTLTTDQALHGATKIDGDFFVVPAVIRGDS